MLARAPPRVGCVRAGCTIMGYTLIGRGAEVVFLLLWKLEMAFYFNFWTSFV
jgi:hypothetical protein